MMNKKMLFKYFALFTTFLKASSFTFVGGLAIIPAIERDLVDRHKLLSGDEFMEYATLSQTMPGVIALNCATLVGRRTAGFGGMLSAGLGAIIPAFTLMIAATVLYGLIPRQGPLMGAMRGVRAASAALVLSAAFTLGRYNLKTAFAVVIMLAAFCLVASGSLGASGVVVLAGAVGVAWPRLRRLLKGRGGHAS